LLGVTGVLSFVLLVKLSAKLHQHELLCYAGAVSMAIETDHIEVNVVPALAKLERTIAQRLRNASESWVRHSLYSIGMVLTLFLMCCMHLLSYHKSSVLDVGPVALGGVMFLSVGWSALYPLAFVAETFEYDVLRYLNNPVLIQNAQRYFGQQMLSHLHTLQWGFRCGGTLITTRIVVNVGGACFLALATSVSQAVFDTYLKS